MTLNLVMGIFVGMVFTCVGIGGLIFSSKKKLYFLFPLFIGSWLLYLQTIGPLSKSGNKLEEVIKINSIDIQEIILKPTKRAGQKDRSLIKTELLITNKKVIERICSTLNKAEKIYDGYVKSVDWLAQLEIKSQNSSIKFGVRKNRAKTSLSVNSNGEYGWNYGTLKCDELGKVLEDEIKEFKPIKK